MISGFTNTMRRPTIAVALVDASGRERTVEAHLDTGFTGDLTLPAAVIEQWGFPFVAITSFTTATGLLTEFGT
jgi:predicted aspartyl protease